MENADLRQLDGPPGGVHRPRVDEIESVAALELGDRLGLARHDRVALDFEDLRGVRVAEEAETDLGQLLAQAGRAGGDLLRAHHVLANVVDAAMNERDGSVVTSRRRQLTQESTA